MIRKKNVKNVSGKKNSASRGKDFRQLFDLAPTAISILENQNRFLYVNKFWEQLTGYRAAETKKMRPLDIIVPESRLEISQRIKKTLNGEFTSGQELEIIHKHGENRWVEYSARLVEFLHKPAVLTVATDITERKKAEQKLKQSREIANHHLENIVFLSESALHFVNNTFEGTIYEYIGKCLKWLNPDAYFIVNSVNMEAGYARTEAIIGIEEYFTQILSILGFNPIGETYPLDDSILRLTTGSIDKFEHGLHELSFGKIPKKITRPIERMIRIGNIYGIAFILDNEIYANAAMIFPRGKDIQNWETVETFVKQASIALKRRQTEQALRESEEKFRTLADLTPTAICIVENQENCLYVNKFWQTLTGYSTADIDNLRPIDLVHPDMKSLIGHKIDQRLKGDDAATEAELKLITREGVIRWINYHAKLINYEGKNAILTAATDITERKASEERIQNLLKEKQILLREVHHRIKNNMSSIEGLLWLQSRRVENPETISALQDACSRIKSMQVLYDKLYRSDNFTEISSKDYLSTLISEVSRLFPNQKQVKIKKRIDDFVIDSKITFPLGIIINELITNCMKHAFPNQSSKNLITVTATCRAQKVTLMIQDNGIGLPDAIDLSCSCGFGLQLVTLLTEQINGRIQLERDPGTKFIIEFNA